MHSWLIGLYKFISICKIFAHKTNIYSSNPKSLPYLVKESCLERLNIRKPPRSSQESGSTANATPQRTWAFVIVETIGINFMINKTYLINFRALSDQKNV
jgi:hypothetical protein